MKKRMAIYLRVSTADQTTANQRQALEAVALKSGWEIVEVFEDHGISGAKGRHQRPAFDSMLKAVARRDIDGIAAWSVDRLGRSLQDLVAFLGEINAAGVSLYLHQQGLDTATPSGKAMFQLLGVFAEFERAIITERINAGIARAKANGQKFGRPSIPSTTEDQIRLLRSQGMGINRIAKTLHVANGTVSRVVATASGAFAPCMG